MADRDIILQGQSSNWMNRKTTFTDWIGLRRNPDYARARPLGTVLGVIIFLIILAITVGGFATLLQFLHEVLRSDADHEAIRNTGLILIAVLGGPFVVWRAVVAQKQANTAEQSHITDQINKAVGGLGTEKLVNKIGRPVRILTGKCHEVTHLVENPAMFELKPRTLQIRKYHDVSHLEEGEIFEGTHIDVKTWEDERTDIEWQGNSLSIGGGEVIAQAGDWQVFSESLSNIEVRVGAIYALERIAQDSPRDHIQIMEILTAYIRENAPVTDLAPSDEPFKPARPRSDIQAALDVIGRRSSELVALEHSKKYRLDLREVDLSSASFRSGNFSGSLLFGSRLEASNFRLANLRGARLSNSLLNFADFFQSDLCGAILDGAEISRDSAWGGSITMASNMLGVSMAGADISAIKHLPVDDGKSPTFATKDTVLEHALQDKRDKQADAIEQFVYISSGIEVNDAEGIKKRLADAGFLYWSPFDATDGATGHLRMKLWNELGLNGFPFQD